MNRKRSKPRRTRVRLDEAHGQGHVEHDPAELKRQADQRDRERLRQLHARTTNDEESQS